jgi:hypothetical protein
LQPNFFSTLLCAAIQDLAKWQCGPLALSFLLPILTSLTLSSWWHTSFALPRSKSWLHPALIWHQLTSYDPSFLKNVKSIWPLLAGNLALWTMSLGEVGAPWPTRSYWHDALHGLLYEATWCYM